MLTEDLGLALDEKKFVYLNSSGIVEGDADRYSNTMVSI